MKFTLKDYQTQAVQDSLDNLRKARIRWHQDNDKHAFSLTAITGSGKTVMAAAAFEALFHGDDDYNFDADPSAVVIWFSDDPSLNEQTRFRLMEASDRIQHSDMIVVQNTFNQAKFEAGKIYFLNTQKLGKKSLLVRGHDQPAEGTNTDDLFPETRPDRRTFTIWDTIRNTIEDSDRTLYLVLDEAHRGIGSDSETSDTSKKTIVQRLINGEHGVPGIPVVWGISATVERFDKAMEGRKTHAMLPPVVVDSVKVQESGLIKDNIILDMPDVDGTVDTVIVRRATDKLRESTVAWSDYAGQQQDVQRVIPVMVLQLPNTPDPNYVGSILDTICQHWPDISSNNIAHVLGEHSTQQFGGFSVPYIAPELVQDSTWVRILIAKDAISTGWDCPRAEVMVSFRAATDRTHITQLLGRMVRSPLARRIPGNDRLNTVDCLLPKFNSKTVVEVVEALMKGVDKDSTHFGRVLINPVEMLPNSSVPDSLWKAFESLPSQSRPQRGAKPAKRLTALAHELAADDILVAAGNKAHHSMHTVIDGFLKRDKNKISNKRKEVLNIKGKTVLVDLQDKSKSFDDFIEDSDMTVINEAYKKATRIFSPDISRSYVDAKANAIADQEDVDAIEEALIEARINIAAMGLVSNFQSDFDAEANKLANSWLATCRASIKKLSHDRQESYREVQVMSTDPQDVDLVKPESRFEPTQLRTHEVVTDLPTYEYHLLCDKNSIYPAQMNDWEIDVVQQELKQEGFMFWYRNPKQPGQSSLGIAYLDGDDYAIMRPDFIFFSEDSDGNIVANIVDPHGTYLAEAMPKLRGLALYAEKHSDVFNRIESVADLKGKLRVLDLTKTAVRQAITTEDSAKALFASKFADDY